MGGGQVDRSGEVRRPGDVTRPPPGRTRLVGVLDRLPSYASVLVAAPAGYGKTSVLRDWVAAAGTAVAWMTIGPHHVAPLSFWSGLVRVLHDVPGRSGPVARGAALAAAGDLDALVSVLHEVVERSGRTVLVLDGIEWVEPGVRQRLALLLEQLPPSLRVVVASRRPSGPTLARPRASGLLAEVGVADLRLDDEESAQLVADLVADEIEPAVVDRIVDRAQGWPMGLILSVRSLRGQELPGRDPVARGYFSNEVLGDVPDDLVEFLTEAAVLDEPTAARCDALRGRTDSHRFLAAAEASMLFVDRPDPDRAAFRFHPMLREALLDILGSRAPGREQHLHRRAAEFHGRAGEHRAAIEHAIVGGDHELALRVLADAAPDLADRGLQDLLRTATATIPDEVIAAEPGRAILFAWSLGHAGRLALCSEWVDRALPTIAPDDHDALAVLATIRSGCAGARGDIEGLRRLQAEADRQVALGGATDDVVFQRKWTYDARCFLAVGRGEEAAGIIERGMSRVATGTAVPAFDRLGLLARLAHHRGHLRRAEEHARHAIAAWQADRLDTPPTLGDALWVQMAVHLERYEDAEAEAALELAEHAVEGLDAPYYPAVVTACARGRFLRLTGHVADARAHLAEVRHGWSEFPGPGPAAPLAAVVAIEELHAALAEGDLDGARLALSRVAGRPDRVLLEARFALAAGDPRVEHLLRSFEPRSTRDVVDHALLLARAATDEDEGRAHVERALEVGVPEGFLRTFVADQVLEAHLREIFRRATSPFVMPVLDHLPRAAATLVEPLTPRERDVLALLPSHLTTPQIGRQLGVSANTVKSHVKAVYRKLGVEGRAEAVAHALGLGLVADGDR